MTQYAKPFVAPAAKQIREGTCKRPSRDTPKEVRTLQHILRMEERKKARAEAKPDLEVTARARVKEALKQAKREAKRRERQPDETVQFAGGRLTIHDDGERMCRHTGECHHD